MENALIWKRDTNIPASWFAFESFDSLSQCIPEIMGSRDSLPWFSLTIECTRRWFVSWDCPFNAMHSQHIEPRGKCSLDAFPHLCYTGPYPLRWASFCTFFVANLKRTLRLMDRRSTDCYIICKPCPLPPIVVDIGLSAKAFCEISRVLQKI